MLYCTENRRHFQVRFQRPLTSRPLGEKLIQEMGVASPGMVNRESDAAPGGWLLNWSCGTSRPLGEKLIQEMGVASPGMVNRESDAAPGGWLLNWSCGTSRPLGEKLSMGIRIRRKI